MLVAILLHPGAAVAIDEAALLHDLDAVADALHLAQQVGGKNDAVRIAQDADERADVAYLRWVEADRGLVEDDDVGCRG